MKCEVCSKEIATTFLGKIKGSYVKDSRGKLRVACFECQSGFKEKSELLLQMK